MAKREMVVVTFKARPEVKEWLTEEAQKGFRSVSAEIAMRLEREMAGILPAAAIGAADAKRQA